MLNFEGDDACKSYFKCKKKISFSEFDSSFCIVSDEQQTGINKYTKKPINESEAKGRAYYNSLQ